MRKSSLFFLALVFFFMLVAPISVKAETTNTVDADESVQSVNPRRVERIQARQELKETVQAEMQEARDEIQLLKDEVKTKIQADKAAFMESRQEKMSEVARQVKLFQEERGDNREGIGQRVREVARNQVQAQEKIENTLQKIEARKLWLKNMFGYNRQDVADLQAEITANQVRIDELNELKSQTTDEAEKAELELMIQALIEQNIYLEESVQTETQHQGLFARFVGFFKRN